MKRRRESSVVQPPPTRSAARTALRQSMTLAIAAVISAALLGWALATILSHAVTELEDPVDRVFASQLNEHDRRATGELLQAAALWPGVASATHNDPSRRNILDGVIYLRLAITLNETLPADDMFQLSKRICSAQERFSADVEVSVRLSYKAQNAHVVCTRPDLAEAVSMLLSRTLVAPNSDKMYLSVSATNGDGVNARIELWTDDPSGPKPTIKSLLDLEDEPGIREVAARTHTGAPAADR